MVIYNKQILGTPIIWGEAGGSGVTNVLSLDALADTAGRMGASIDLGIQWDQPYLAALIVETGTAPAAGRSVELYFAWSYDNIFWPGKVTGVDAAYPATVADNKKQLGIPAVILISTADGNTTLRQQPEIITPKGRYVTPVVINLLGQAFRDQATNSNNASRAILIPLIQSTV